MQEIYLDLSQRNLPAVIQTKQGDVGRKFKAIFLDCDSPYAIPEDAVISVWYSGAGGEGNYTAIDGRPAAVVQGNTVVIELIPQMLANSGGGNLCLTLSKPDGSQIGTWNVLYTCEGIPGIDSLPATDYFTAMSEIARQVLTAAERMEVDTTLRQTGKAADAKAVGDALYSFGWGKELVSRQRVNDLNDPCLMTGFYCAVVDAENSPAGFGGGPLFVICWYEEIICTQFLMNNDLTQLYTRTFKDDIWQPWVLVNPRLENNVRSLTSECYLDRPVYVYQKHLNALPNNSLTRVSIDPNIDGGADFKLVDVNIVLKSGGAQYANQQHLPAGHLTHYVEYTGSQWELILETDFDGRNYSAEITIKYTWRA